MANPDSQHTRGAADHPLIFVRGPWTVSGGVGRLEGGFEGFGGNIDAATNCL